MNNHWTTLAKTAAVLVLIARVGIGEGKAQVKNAVKINVLSLGAKTLSGLYERALGDHWSVQVGLLYTPTVTPPWSNTTISGYGITPEVRFYTQRKKQALDGFYVGSYLRYRYNSLSYRDAPTDEQTFYFSKNTFGAGVLLGYQLLIVNKQLSLDFFAGPHLSRHWINPLDNSQHYNYQGMFQIAPLGVRTGVTIGYAFK